MVLSQVNLATGNSVQGFKVQGSSRTLNQSNDIRILTLIDNRAILDRAAAKTGL
jgi:hypothetical protein